MLDGPDVDPVKLVALLAGTGTDGVAVERGLIEAGLPVEMADRDTIVALATLADDTSSIARLVTTWSTKPAASNRMSTMLPGTMRSSTKMMTEIPNRVTSINTRRRTI